MDGDDVPGALEETGARPLAGTPREGSIAGETRDPPRTSLAASSRGPGTGGSGHVWPWLRPRGPAGSEAVGDAEQPPHTAPSTLSGEDGLGGAASGGPPRGWGEATFNGAFCSRGADRDQNWGLAAARGWAERWGSRWQGSALSPLVA